MDILIWPGYSVVGLEIAEQLRFMKNIRIYCGTSESNHPLASMFDGTVVIPNLKLHNGKIDSNIFNKYVIFPAHDFVLDFIASSENEMNWIGSSKDLMKLTRSKSKAYEKMASTKLAASIPKIYDAEDLKSLDSEVYLKPDDGYGSQGHILLDPKEALALVENNSEKYVISEYLLGDEFTVECFSDTEGNLLYAGPRKRSRVRMGTSLSFEQPSSRVNAIHISLAKEISSVFKFSGPWYFQTKSKNLASEDFKILEVSCRLPGSSVWSRSNGVNLSELAVWNHLGLKLEIEVNDSLVDIERDLSTKMRFHHNFLHTFIDFDETITHRGKLNPWAIAFLIQQKNNEKPIHLITKSLEPDLDGLLQHLGIRNLFTTINQISLTDDKSKYVHSTDGIFIDDSFSERSNVRKQIGIPCFGPDIFQLLVI